MFKTSNSSKKKPKPVQSRYNVPEQVTYEEEPLWDVPTAEYRAWNVPQLVLNVLDVEGNTYYEAIKHILEQEKVPTHLGYVWQAVYELENAGLVELERKPQQSTKVKLKTLDYDEIL